MKNVYNLYKVDSYNDFERIVSNYYKTLIVISLIILTLTILNGYFNLGIQIDLR